MYGHEDKKTFFENLIKKGMLAHAYLFFGEPQIGKRHFAKHLAHLLEQGEFKIREEVLIDTVFITPDEDKKTIGIQKLRDMRDFLHERPIKSRKRLIIIDNAHILTPEAQASLLKFVEDAPEYTTFIFITHDPQSLLPPLISRLQKIFFSKLSKKEIKNILDEEYNLKQNEAEKITDKSFGRIGRAISLIKGENYDEDNLGEYIEKKITNLYLKDKIKNSKTLKWLSEEELKIKRYTVNPKLHRKVIDSKTRI